MKKLITFTLIFILCVNIFGTHFIYYLGNYHINNSIDNRIQKGNLEQFEKVTFSINLPIQLPYMPVKFENEFTGEWLYKGNIYRFVKSNIVGDKIIYTCITNPEGKKLLQAFAKEMLNASHSKNPLKKSAKSISFDFLKNYIHQENKCSIFKSYFHINHCTNYINNYKSGFFIQLPVPPPEFNC